MEAARKREKKQLQALKNELYDQQNRMQIIQSELEVISDKNSILEQEFESSINKKNRNTIEIGQIISGVNNIWSLCKVRAAKKGKRVGGKDGITFTDERDVLQVLMVTLDRAMQIIDELVKVSKEFGQDYSREKAYG